MYSSTLILLFGVHFASSQDITASEDIRILRELSLRKLLEVKRSFQTEYDNSTTLHIELENKADRLSGPEALALQSKNPSRGGYEHYDYEEHDSKKGSKKGIENFFQLSITALSFLAFGGYLLCLIVQTIKGKQMDQMTQMANMQMMASLLRRQATRRRINKPRRTSKPSRLTKSSNKKRPRREVENWVNVDPDKMYHTLVILSEAYKNYHSIDLKNYNKTMRYFNYN
ncbi:hypothetical protein WA026_006105 [Henosepilachna vigintioctopunctata]|uniref:Uncharacterized protein n=1 Tax=Henosepilachna vigintioctopunctata TaxID=420089 RepID=A0AAW1TJJ7_9CUCU